MPIDPQTNSFLVLSDTNGGWASDDNAGLSIDSPASQTQGSSIVGQLSIQSGNPATQVFLGNVVANPGSASNLGAAGISAATGD